MNCNYYIKRYNSLYKNYIGNGGCKIFYFIDWLVSFVIDGSSFYDYFAYGFYRLRYGARNEFMTCRKHKKVMKLCNNQKKIAFFRDKSEFNKLFHDFIKRESLEINESTEDQFVDFCRNHEEIFVKDKYGLCGRNIRVVRMGDTDPIDLFNSLKRDRDATYIVENVLKQHDAISALHPWSVNTIRIVTLYDKSADKVTIMCARLRIGNKRNRVDNFHYDGLCAPIDLNTGIVESYAYNKNGDVFILHPETGLQIVGFKIPNWIECLKFTEKAARIVPEVGYVGWDIVVQNNNQFALIEGNDNADHDVQQIGRKGIWKKYKQILRIK